MADVYVMAKHAQPTYLTDYTLMVPVEMLEGMFPGGMQSFAETYHAIFIPGLEACAVVGNENVMAAKRALDELGFEYAPTMVKFEGEFEIFGRRTMRPLPNEETSVLECYVRRSI